MRNAYDRKQKEMRGMDYGKGRKQFLRDDVADEVY